MWYKVQELTGEVLGYANIDVIRCLYVGEIMCIDHNVQTVYLWPKPRG